MNDILTQVQRALTEIERRLFEELPLSHIARSAGCSAFRFHRLFSAITGETPAGYVRKRRFAELCRRLVESEAPMVELALCAGFESQASFTRAFTRHIGVSPGRYRKTGVVQLAHRYARLDAAELVARKRRLDMEPRIEHRPAIHVIGMTGEFTPTTNTRIPELWGRFSPRMNEIEQRHGATTFGVCLETGPASAEECSFVYVAAVEVKRIEAVPVGMVALTIPSNTYAVFTHCGHVSRIADTVKNIWGTWLPASRYQHLSAPDFEYYDHGRFDDRTGEGEIDIYVPITTDAPAP